MEMRGITFPTIFNAPGARGFFGEGYPFHRIAKYFGMTWQGTGFAAKTATLEPRLGNMPLKHDGLTPRELIPRCMYVDFRSGHTLNAVGLSNIGLGALLKRPGWRKWSDGPFFLSFMAMGDSNQEKLRQYREMVELLKPLTQHSYRPWGLQLNFACPNVGAHVDSTEMLMALTIANDLGVPLVANVSPIFPVESLVQLVHHPACDGLWIANTIPWGDPNIDWVGLFGSETSPLTRRGLPSPGGLSGPRCFPLSLYALKKLRAAGVTKPIVIGNGIQSVLDVHRAFQAGANGIAIGIVGIVRPWRMRSIIRVARTYAT